MQDSPLEEITISMSYRRSQGPFLRGLGTVILLAGATHTAAAAELNPERFSLSLGAFITERDTKARLDSDLIGPGTEIDFEADLGLRRSESVFRLDSFYRVARRHRIDFSVFDLSRSATAVIDEQIQFGDEVFDVNAEISAGLDLRIIKLAYTYSFLDRPEGYLGVTGGLYVADVGVFLREVMLGTLETGDVTAPLPVIGLRGAYALADKWTLRGGAELFALEFDEVKGQLFDIYAGVEYAITDRFKLGLAYNSVSLDVDVTDSDLSGSLDWSYDGVILSAGIGFGGLATR